MQPHRLVASFEDADAQGHLTLGGELDGVAGEVEQDLLQPQRVADQEPRESGGCDDPQFQPLGPGGLTHEARDPTQQGGEVEGGRLDAQLAGLDLGQIQDVPQDGEQRAPGNPDALDHVALLGDERGSLQDLRQTQHGVQRGADLVAHVGQEFALGGIGRLGGVTRLLDRQFIAFALSDVGGDAVGNQAPVAPVGRGRLVADPEPVAVAAPDPVLDVIGLAVAEERGIGVLHPLQVVRVDAAQEECLPASP